MNDVIHLLPDAIANQIAAGEVIQRPASVVKELVENAIDAGATHIQLNVKDAGRTLIQVIDNGKGMSPTDARLAFERHATSKIRTADDLYSLRTMGFRGEALPSIVAVAQVELKTRRADDELGTYISIAGSEVQEQTHVSAAVGTDISVKNLFFNVPARRKFLKANATELRQIMICFQRIVLVYPDIAFDFYHNGAVVYSLKASNFRQRIVAVAGKKLGSQLLDMNEENDLVKIRGFVGTPETARKKDAQEFFFVNGRYMNHAYFHKAVMQAYERMLPPDSRPNYFIYFEIDPAAIDVNVHPTKTEIKFENENHIWTILLGTVKETLGKFNMLPPITFEPEVSLINDFVPTPNVEAPTVRVNQNYNPFEVAQKSTYSPAPRRPAAMEWEKLYADFEKKAEHVAPPAPESEEEELGLDVPSGGMNLFSVQKRFIATSVESGLMLIDQHRAHVRILYERNMTMMKEKNGHSQTLLFPEKMEINPALLPLLRCLWDDLRNVGFDIKEDADGLQVNAVPSALAGHSAIDVLSQILADEIDLDEENIRSGIRERIALVLAKSAAVQNGKRLTQAEMEEIFNALFALKSPNYTPDGKLIIGMVSTGELEKMFD